MHSNVVHASLFHAQHSFLHFRHRFPDNNNNKIYTVRFLFLLSVYKIHWDIIKNIIKIIIIINK
jgi:hypothetical protein